MFSFFSLYFTGFFIRSFISSQVVYFSSSSLWLRMPDRIFSDIRSGTKLCRLHGNKCKRHKARCRRENGRRGFVLLSVQEKQNILWFDSLCNELQRLHPSGWHCGAILSAEMRTPSRRDSSPLLRWVLVNSSTDPLSTWADSFSLPYFVFHCLLSSHAV